MSKKFYVIFTLKEYVLPKVFKTKGTVNKYLDDNPKLTFKFFNSETQANNFSKDIESQLHTKFIAKVQNQIHEQFKPFKKATTFKTTNLKPALISIQPTSHSEAEPKPQDKPRIAKSDRVMKKKQENKQMSNKQVANQEIEPSKDIGEDEPSLAEEEDITISKEQLLKELTDNMKRIESEMLAKKKQAEKQIHKIVMKQSATQYKQKQSQLEPPAEKKRQAVADKESTESFEDILDKFKADIKSKVSEQKQKSKPPAQQLTTPGIEEPVRIETTQVSSKIEENLKDSEVLEEKKLTLVEPLVFTAIESELDQIDIHRNKERVIGYQISQIVFEVEAQRQALIDDNQQKFQILQPLLTKRQSEPLAPKAVEDQNSPQQTSHITNPPQYAQTQYTISISNEQPLRNIQQQSKVSTQSHPKEQEQYPAIIQQLHRQAQQIPTGVQEAQQALFTQAGLVTDIKCQGLTVDGPALTNIYSEYFLQQNYINLPQLHLQSKLCRLNRPFANSTSARLSLNLLQNQNPGFCIGFFKLETGEGTIQKLEHFGTKNRLHAQALCLKSGLQLAAINQIQHLQIGTTFGCSGNRSFKKSIDKRLSQMAGTIESIAKQFKRIHYL